MIVYLFVKIVDFLLKEKHLNFLLVVLFSVI